MTTTTTTTEHEATVAALRASVFGALTPSQLDDIAQLSDLRHVEAGGTLCAQGAFGQEAFLIADGCVSVVVDGAEVARRGLGDIVGDWAMFGGGYRAATLRALSAVDTVVIDAREIDFLLTAAPAAADVLGPQPSGQIH